MYFNYWTNISTAHCVYIFVIYLYAGNSEVKAAKTASRASHIPVRSPRSDKHRYLSECSKLSTLKVWWSWLKIIKPIIRYQHHQLANLGRPSNHVYRITGQAANFGLLSVTVTKSRGLWHWPHVGHKITNLNLFHDGREFFTGGWSEITLKYRGN